MEQEVTQAQLPTSLSDADKLTLQLAQSAVKLALSEAKLALANNEKAELTYKYLVLQLFRKYNLPDSAGINEDGTFTMESK